MTDAPRYFFNREGARSGPHTLEEIVAFIGAGEITTSSWVFREGDEKWKAATTFPELTAVFPEATAPEAAAARVPTPPAAASSPAAASTTAAARPSSLTRVPYTAGATPTAPGPYVRLDHLAGDAVALLTAAIPEPPKPYKRHRLRTPLLVAAFALLGAAVAADRASGFDRWMFTEVLGPVAAIGFLLVMLATHSRPGLALAALRKIDGTSVAGIIAAALPILGLGGVLLFLLSETPEAAWRRLAVLAASFLFVVVARRLRDRPSSALTRRESARVEMMTACRDIVSALADDVAAGKKVGGWADLTGAQQPDKLMARGTSASGAKVELFRDEWFRLTAPLRDGTRLRLAAVDREKQKHPHTRTRNGKRKTKPGSTQTLSTLEIRAHVNTQVYRTLAPEAQTGPVHALQLTSIKATPDAVSAVFTRSEGLHLAEVMHALAHVYRHLERIPAAGEGGTP